jgi:hypothetical protein
MPENNETAAASSPSIQENKESPVLKSPANQKSGNDDSAGRSARMLKREFLAYCKKNDLIGAYFLTDSHPELLATYSTRAVNIAVRHNAAHVLEWLLDMGSELPPTKVVLGLQSPSQRILEILIYHKYDINARYALQWPLIYSVIDDYNLVR